MAGGEVGLRDRTPTVLRGEVAWACRILAEHGFADLTLGHVSSRDPDDPNRIWIKRRGISLAEVEPDDVLALDLGAEPGPEMHLETVLHTEVYKRRPDVRSVVHGHPPYATALGATDAPLLQLTHDAVLFEGGIPSFDDPDLITSARQGGEVAAALGAAAVVLLRNHGVLVAERDVRWTTLTAVTLERAVMLQSLAATLGEPRPIDAGLLGDLKQRKYDDYLVNEYWDAWTRDMDRRGTGLETSEKEAYER